MANAAFAIEVVESFDEVGPQDGEGEDVGEEWRGACEREKVVGEVGEEGVGDCEPEEAVVEVEEEHFVASFSSSAAAASAASASASGGWEGCWRGE